MIYENQNIRGLLINNFEIKLTQFADDTTLILDGTQNSLQVALNIIETYGNISGLRMNTDKTKIIWLGRQRSSKDKLQTTHKLDWGSTEFKLLGINYSTDLNIVCKINFDNILNTIAKEMASWNRRNISPIGRIALIKSLFLSKLNHIFLTIPSLNDNLIKQIEGLLFKFLWKSKPDKISRKCITQNYEDGGLKMVDIRTFILSLKITWIRRIFNTPDNLWVKLFKHNYCIPSNLVINGSNWLEVVNKTIGNKFWNEVIDAYRLLLIDYKPRNKLDFLSAPVWYNPNISFNNDFSNRFTDKGINFIADILDNHGNLLSHQEMQNIMSINITWYDYIVIKLSIKKYLKSINITLPVSVTKPLLPLNLKPIIHSKKGCRDFYNILNKKNAEVKATSKWSNKLGFNLSKENWKHIFRIAHKSVQDNVYKWFQIKIIHRILGTRSLTFKMGLTQTKLCGLCQNSEETLIHLFTECDKTNEIWANLSNEIGTTCNTVIVLDTVTKLFGYQNSTSFAEALNTILIIMRYYIFSKCKSEGDLFISEYKRLLKRVYIEQELLSKLNNKNELFTKKWAKLNNFIYPQTQQ